MIAVVLAIYATYMKSTWMIALSMALNDNDFFGESWKAQRFSKCYNFFLKTGKCKSGTPSRTVGNSKRRTSMSAKKI
jgi:hypothetical protein